jgi:acetylornithine deacetylase/succinyl-diaminopimelate desuccinylase-like protein
VAHQANEFVPLEELRAATRIYALLIADLLGRED